MIFFLSIAAVVCQPTPEEFRKMAMFCVCVSMVFLPRRLRFLRHDAENATMKETRALGAGALR